MASEPIDRSKVAKLIDEAQFFLSQVEEHVIGVVPEDDELREQFEREARNAAEQLDAQVSSLIRELGDV